MATNIGNLGQIGEPCRKAWQEFLVGNYLRQRVLALLITAGYVKWSVDCDASGRQVYSITDGQIDTVRTRLREFSISREMTLDGEQFNEWGKRLLADLGINVEFVVVDVSTAVRVSDETHLHLGTLNGQSVILSLNG